MKLVLFYIVLAIGLIETAIFLLKECYRGKRLLELRREILSLPWKDNLSRHHDLSVEIAKAILLPVNVRSFPNRVKEKFLPFCIIVDLLLAGIILWGVSIFGLSPSCPASLAMIASWIFYKLAMEISDHLASKKNLIANEIRVEKYARARNLALGINLGISLVVGFITYFTLI